ncbi:MAG: hypothetical protein OXJ52_05810, partial [Oligoflexia bacterium]|nr:hypothetical protein [Oligoflexia bacterium]
MNQKFYSLNPQFYLHLWTEGLGQLRSNKNLKNADFKHKLKKALSGWHNQLLFDSAFLENPNFNLYIKTALEHNIKPALQITPACFKKHKDQILLFNQSYKNSLDFHFICDDISKIPFKELEVLDSSIHC